MINSLQEINEASYIFFSIGKSNYGFDTSYVLDIMQLVELEYPEKMPNFIIGLLKHNDKYAKIIDLKKALDLEPSEYDLNARIILIKGKQGVFGVLADHIDGIKRINTFNLDSPPYETEKSCLKAIYTKKDFSSTIINIDNLENKINSFEKESQKGDLKLPSLFTLDEAKKEILHRRRLHYAAKNKEVAHPIIKSQDAYITFKLGTSTACIKILHVLGFYKFSNIKLTKIPCTPDFIMGVTSIKGRYITIIDLLTYTEKKHIDTDKDLKIIVIGYEDYQIGIVTDAIGETMDIDESRIKIDPSVQKSCLRECIINDSMYLLLDIKKLFGDEKLYVS